MLEEGKHLLQSLVTARLRESDGKSADGWRRNPEVERDSKEKSTFERDRDSRDSRESRDNKDGRDSRDMHDSRDTRDVRDSKDGRDMRDSRDRGGYDRDRGYDRFERDRDRSGYDRDRGFDRERDRGTSSVSTEQLVTQVAMFTSGYVVLSLLMLWYTSLIYLFN
jgi:hypothetical protein